MSGFITIQRNTWDHPVLVRSEMSETEAWAWMIARASWTGTTHMVGSEMVEVPRGSFIITLRKLQSEFMWQSDKRVRNFLKKLENHRMLAVQTLGQRNARKTHVTICNYDEYQALGRSKDAAKTHDGRTTDAVKKPSNQVTSKRDTTVSPKKGTRLPDDWVLSKADGDWALGEGATDDQIRYQSEQFRDYWHSVSGAKAVKQKWSLVWKTWMRRAIKETPTLKFKAINGGNSHDQSANNEHRVQRIVTAAAKGTSGQDWG